MPYLHYRWQLNKLSRGEVSLVKIVYDLDEKTRIDEILQNIKMYV